LRQRVAATIEHRHVPFGNDFATVLDAGAHNGQFSLFALERFPAARVICFEPQSAAAEKIRALMSDEPRVEVMPFALADTSGTAELQVSKRSDSSSLLPISSSQTDAFPGTERASLETIEVRTLDSLLADGIDRPCLLKVDVQGGELALLKGAAATLESVDSAFVECSFIELYEGQALADEVVAFLSARGLRLRGVFSVSTDTNGRCLQADFLFERD
jgi:FkbM family methyltransferase